jgi:hypothetical protein
VRAKRASKDEAQSQNVFQQPAKSFRDTATRGYADCGLVYRRLTTSSETPGVVTEFRD